MTGLNVKTLDWAVWRTQKTKQADMTTASSPFHWLAREWPSDILVNAHLVGNSWVLGCYVKSINLWFCFIMVQKCRACICFAKINLTKTMEYNNFIEVNIKYCNTVEPVKF